MSTYKTAENQQPWPPAPTPQAVSAALKAVERLHPFIRIDLPPWKVLILIGLLQDIIRHPECPQSAIRVAREFIDAFALAVNEATIRRVIAIGYDERYDDAKPVEPKIEAKYAKYSREQRVIDLGKRVMFFRRMLRQSWHNTLDDRSALKTAERHLFRIIEGQDTYAALVEARAWLQDRHKGPLYKVMSNFINRIMPETAKQSAEERGMGNGEWEAAGIERLKGNRPGLREFFKRIIGIIRRLKPENGANHG